MSSFTVTFSTQGHGSDVPSQTITALTIPSSTLYPNATLYPSLGGLVSRPTDPTATGYTFGGWYKEAACTNAWDFANDRVSSNIVLYAKWTIITYTLTYNLNGGTVSPANPTTYTVETPTFTLNNPTKTGVTFKGWTTSGSSTYVKDVTIEIGSTGNKTYTANYGIEVSFDTLGLSFPPVTQSINSGGTVTKPTDPVASGYEFDAWYTNRDYTNLYNFASTVTSSFILYAKWRRVQEVDIDWSASMQQTYEFYKVDPSSWKDTEKITDIESCSITRDLSVDTLGSASFDCTNEIDECYIRVYMIAIQNGISHRLCLGTYLVQTPSVSFDGKKTSITMDGYTSLIELKNKMPSIGFTVRKDTAVMSTAYEMTVEHLRAPVFKPSNSKTLYDHFIANSDDTWFSFLSDLISQADYSFGLDNDGSIIFEPYVKNSAKQPTWVYTDDNSSILLPDISDERDLYEVPNVVEVVYSNNSNTYISRVVNNDPNSIVSVQNRGREVVYRDTSPSVSEDMTGSNAQQYLDSYAQAKLESLSELQHTVTYSHGYCPVKIGDGVMLNYKRAGLENIKAVVTAQSFNCEPGCAVEETAVYTTSLYGEDSYISRKITYVTFYGTAPASKYVKKTYHLSGLDIQEPLESGEHDFVGWFYGYSSTTKAQAGDEVLNNITLYARWDEED